MADFFEDLEQRGPGSEGNKPFFAIDHESDQTILDWFSQNMSSLRIANEKRHQKIKNNYARYKGIQYREQVYMPRDQAEKRVRYMPQIVVPLISDSVDEKVARLLEFKPTVNIIPHGDEEQDKIDVKVAKRFIKHIETIEDLDTKFRSAVKSCKIAGESFLSILWNTDLGENIVPAGKVVDLPDGRKVKGPLYQGDIDIRKVTALSVLYERAMFWEDVEYIYSFEYVYTEKLKFDYPESADKIYSSKSSNYYDFESMDLKSLDGMSSVVTFWHKKTKYLPDGYECKFVDGKILKKGPLPYDHGDLPFERFIDVENEGELSGESGIEKVRGLASQYNNLTNTIIKQQNLCSHPKWFIDANSLDEQSLGNDVSIVRLKAGSRDPRLAQGNPVSPQVFEFRKELKNEFYEMSKSNSLVRGEPPPGVTAFVALQYLSESENRRMSSEVASTNSSIRCVYEKVLKTCGQYYKATDERTLLILGKDNRWNVMKYDPATLAKPYFIMIQSGSALPDSKALRTQFLLDMSQRFPAQFTQEQVIEMLDLGQSEKFMDIAAKSAAAAEAENEMILDGSALPDPEPWENQIVHWKTHVGIIQDIGFKMNASEEIQENMKDHIMAHEMIMLEAVAKNPTLAQLISMECPQFPIFMTPEVPPMDPMGMGQPMDVGPGMEQTKQDVKSSGQSFEVMPGDPGFTQVPTPEGSGAAPI